jgi:hypothetical protein
MTQALKPGDILRDLPPHLQYLENTVYVADNEDDSILVATLEPYKEPVTWKELEENISKVNRDWAKDTNPQMRIGTTEDWDTLLKSEFTKRTGLYQPPRPGLEPNYWQESPMHKIRSNVRTVRNPHAPESTYVLDAKNGKAFGHRFADVPRIELGL